MDYFIPLGQDDRLNSMEEHDKQKDSDSFADDSDNDKFEKGIVATTGDGRV